MSGTAPGSPLTSQADIVKIVGPCIGVDPWREKVDEAESIAELQRLLNELMTLQRRIRLAVP